MGTHLAYSGLLNILLSLIGIMLTWYALQSIQWNALVKNPRSRSFQLLLILLSLTIGHGFARFVMDYLSWASMLGQFF